MSGIIRKVIEEVWNQKNPALLDDMFTEDFVMHTPIGNFEGPSGYRQIYDTYVNAFSDCQFTIDDELSAGDRNVVRYTFSGTHDGELLGVAPTGKRVSISGISISRLVGGKVAEEWPVWDQMGVMQQIGAVS
ncbi:MAG: ester cyclase [Gemmatimonadetes bacterium]|nr:ester cyclase [Gemmatimonadota bacterium]